MADEMMAIMWELNASGEKFTEKMIAYIRELESLNANPLFLQLLQNLSSVQHSDHEILSNMMHRLLGYIQHLVPDFVKDDLKKWKWSEMAHPTKTKEENSKLLNFTKDYFKKLLEGVDLLLKVCQLFQNQFHPLLNNLSDLEKLKTDLLENALIVHFQPFLRCTDKGPCIHKGPCTCAQVSIQAVKEGTNFGLGVKFLADPEPLAPDTDAGVSVVGTVAEPLPGSTKRRKTTSKPKGQGQGQGQRTFKIFKITKDEPAELYKNLPVVQNLLGLPARNFMNENSVTVDGNEYIFHPLKIPGRKSECDESAREHDGPSVKSRFLITTTVNILGQYKEVWACSLPIVYIKNRTQECAATSTFFWDNYFRIFSQDSPIPFQVPESVPWDKFKEGINSFFKSTTGTTRGLTDADLKYFGEKIFRNNNNFEADNLSVSRVKFCSGRYFPNKNEYELNPWTWLYFIMELIKNHLKEHWETGKIMGFIDRKKAENLLSQRGSGSFLLRFTDQTLGGISISACTAAGITSLDPFFSDDLKKRKIEQIVRDLPTPSVLIVFDTVSQTYRDLPKESAFPAPEPQETEKKGYDKREFVAAALTGAMSNLSLQTSQNGHHSMSTDMSAIPTPAPIPIPIPEATALQYIQLPLPAQFQFQVQPASPFSPEYYDYSSPGSIVPSQMQYNDNNYTPNYSVSPNSQYVPSPSYVNSQSQTPSPMPTEVPKHTDDMSDLQVPERNQSTSTATNAFDQEFEYSTASNMDLHQTFNKF